MRPGWGGGGAKPIRKLSPLTAVAVKCLTLQQRIHGLFAGGREGALLSLLGLQSFVETAEKLANAAKWAAVDFVSIVAMAK